MKLLGKTKIGGTSFDLAADSKRVARYTVAQESRVVRLQVYADGLGSGTGDQLLRGVIYDSTGTLVAQGDPVLIHDGDAARWVDLTFLNYSGGVLLAAGDYDLGVQGGANSNTIRVYTDATSVGTAAGALTLVSGNPVTDAIRTAGLVGDGRAAETSYGMWTGVTNVEASTAGADVSFEAATTGYTTGGTNTIASDAGQAKFGAKSCKATYSNNVLLLDIALTVPTANRNYATSRWVYIPTNYDGGGITLRYQNFTGMAAGGTTGVAANMALRDQWQRLTLPNIGIGADTTGNVQIINTGAAPTVGRFIYIDGCQTETGAGNVPCRPFTITATADAKITAPATGTLDATTGWVAMRFRMGVSGSSMPNANQVVIPWWWGSTTTGDAFGFYIDNASFNMAFRRPAPAASRIASAAGVPAWAIGDVFTLVGFWDANGVYVTLNGGAVGQMFYGVISGGAAAVADATFRVGWDDPNGWGGEFDGDILWMATGNGAISNAQAQALSALTNDPTFAALPSSATMLWTAATLATTLPFHTGRSNADTFLDGASAIFGASSPLDFDLSIYGTYSTHWVSPDRPLLEEAALPWIAAQEKLKGSVFPSRPGVLGWYGSQFDDDYGSLALVSSTGPFAALAGQRLALSLGTKTVYVYCKGTAKLNDGEGLAVPRRVYSALSLPTTVPIPVEVAVVE